MKRRGSQLEISLPIGLLISCVSAITSDFLVGEPKLQLRAYKMLRNCSSSLIGPTFCSIENIRNDAGDGLAEVNGYVEALLVEIVLLNAIHKMRFQLICDRYSRLIVETKRFQSRRHQQSKARGKAQRAARRASTFNGKLARFAMLFEHLLDESPA